MVVMITGYLLSMVRWAHGWFGFGNRVYLTRSTRELVAELNGKTDIQIKDITRRYRGTWLQVPVEIIGVTPIDASLNLIYLVQRYDPAGIRIAMSFAGDAGYAR